MKYSAFSCQTILLMCIFLLTGCGSGGSEEESPTSESDNTNTLAATQNNHEEKSLSASEDNNSTVSELKSIAGIWDITHEGDVYYQIIRENGTYTDYDFQGDELDEGEDCYKKYDGVISSEGNRQYKFGENFFVSVAPQDEGFVSHDGFLMLTYKPTPFAESDFSPLCVTE